MRALAWFSGGFAAACLWACYSGPGPLLLLAAALMLAAAAAVWALTRPRAGTHPLRLRRPADRPRTALYQTARRAVALTLGALLASGWTWGYAALFRAPAERWVGEEVPLTGEIASYPAPTSIGGYSMTVRLDGGFSAPDALLYGDESWGGLAPGDRFSCTARVQPSTRTRGDETTYYTAKGIWLLAYARGEGAFTPAGRIPLRYWPALCARRLGQGIAAAFDETAAPIAAAVALGDKSGLDEGLSSALSRAGLTHAAVVSGLHISVLAAFLLAITRGRRKIALAMVPCLLFYALMAGGGPSAVRAVVMQSALLLAPILRREQDGPCALSLALLVLLIQNPFAAASVGLQLSFASVAGILLASQPLFLRMYKPWRKRRPAKEDKLRTALWKGVRAALSAVSVTLGAILFTTPLIALYFGQIVLMGPLSGVLALWALSALLPCALVLGTLALVLPGPAALLGRIAGLLAHYARWVALGLGRFPFASLSTDSPYCVLWLGTVYLALLGAALSREKPRRPLAAVGALALLLCAAIGLGGLEAASRDLTVSVLDVGQGSCAALLSGGQAALVDCGGSGSHSAGDIAADHFAAMGRVRLDLLVLTHFDDDHCNGAEQLFRRMKVAAVAYPAGEESPEPRERLLALAQAEGARLLPVDETMVLPLGDASLTLFPPLGGGTSNESGLFALCSHGDFDALITGDADAFVEKMLVKYCPIPDVELLVVGHHGSKNSSCEPFLAATAPELAVISAGAGNSYGHPAPETLERLDALGARTCRTDLDGTVTVFLRAGKVGVISGS